MDMISVFTTSIMVYGFALLINQPIKSTCVCTGPLNSVCFISKYTDKGMSPKKEYIKITLRDQDKKHHLRSGKVNIQCVQNK